MMKRPTALMIGISALFLTMSLALPQATASNWSGASGVYGTCSTGVNRTDNSAISFYYSDLSTHMDNRVDWVREHRVDTTDMQTSMHSSASSSTDVIVLDQSYDDYCGINWDAGVWGMTTCRSVQSNGSCQQSNVRFNNTFTAGMSGGSRNSLVCHEVGHAIGLLHREATGCIRSGNLSSDSYSSHDRAHINNAF